MIESNLRKEAKKFAEYITGQQLRKYLAYKVKKYLGDEPLTVFDGAVGSGQLEQHLNVSRLVGCDIQEQSVKACRQNYNNADITCESFFNFNPNITADCVVMNPPFSLKFKDIPDEEQENIQKDFDFKKGGVLDEIFLLKSLKYTKRYAFYIMFGGIAYRKQEQTMRDIIGTQLVEANIIKNAFDDTAIDVLFIVLDKEKKDNKYYSELYDCKADKPLICSENFNFNKGDNWETAKYVEPKEEIDIKQVNKEIIEIALRKIKTQIETEKLLCEEFKGSYQDLNTLINGVYEILDEYKQYCTNRQFF